MAFKLAARRYAGGVRYSGMTERDDDEPWFRLGQLDVTTTTFVLVVWVFTLFVFAVEPVNKPVMTGMALVPDKVAIGEVWRIVAWPWSHFGFGLWDILSAAFFWYFGTELEKQIGRRPFARLLGFSVVTIGAVASVVAVLVPNDTVLHDLGLLNLTVLLLYIAEHPMRPFFFGIPLWVVGAAIAAIELINDLARRDWLRFLSIIIAGVLIMLVARKVNLLTSYDWVPNLRRPGRKRRDEKPASGAPGAGRKRSKPKPAPEPKKRSGPLWGRGRTEEPEAEIVQMPTSRRRPIPTNVPEVSVDDLALDALLDKIADGGLDALSDAERRELDELRERRRGGHDRPPG